MSSGFITFPLESTKSPPRYLIWPGTMFGSEPCRDDISAATEGLEYAVGMIWADTFVAEKANMPAKIDKIKLSLDI